MEKNEPTIEDYQQEVQTLNLIINGMKKDFADLVEQKNEQNAQNQLAVVRLANQVKDLTDKLQTVESQLAGDENANPDN